MIRVRQGHGAAARLIVDSVCKWRRKRRGAGVDLQLAVARPQRERLFREEVNMIPGSGVCGGGRMTTCSALHSTNGTI